MYRENLRQIFRAAQFPVQPEPELAHYRPSPGDIAELREKSYFDQWKVAISNKWYHLKLEDHSLFVFHEDDQVASHSFMHCPLKVETMAEFLATKGLELTARNVKEYTEEYGLVIETAQVREHVHPIRFDFDIHGYREGVHPQAHIHIGLENQIRIAVSRRLSPAAFVLFVMRQLYPECWKRLLDYRAEFKLDRVVRKSLETIATDRWTDLDQLELHLA